MVVDREIVSTEPPEDADPDGNGDRDAPLPAADAFVHPLDPRGLGHEIFVDSRDGASIFARLWTPDNATPDNATPEHDPPTVLILDGIGCSGWAFRRIVPHLARRYPVALMHYRGHGRSPDPPRPWRLGIADCADDAAAVIEALGLNNVVVIGFSMGFQVALELYRRHRGHVAGLVSLAGPAGRVLSTFQGTGVFGHGLPLLRAAMRHAHDLTERLWKRIVPSQWIVDLGLATQLNADRIEEEDFTFYLDQMAAMNPELFFDMLQHAARHCADDLLPEVGVPTMVVAGANDTFVPLSTMRRMAFAIPDARWVVVDGASHALPAEFPGEVTQHVMDFVAALQPGAAEPAAEPTPG